MNLYQVRNKAEGLIERLGIHKIPVDVEEIAKRLGLRVLYEDLGGDVSGALIVSGAGANIIVQASDTKNRQRFTIGHEIAHYYLGHQFDDEKGVHVDKGNFISRRDSTSSTGLDQKEIEANQFAASLLMPPSLIMRELDGIGTAPIWDHHVALLARRFGVSEHAMTIRLTRLRLL